MWFYPWKSSLSAGLQEHTLRFFFNYFDLCLIPKGTKAHNSSWASSHKKREFYADRALTEISFTSNSCDDHFWSWPNVTLFKRPISTFFQRIKLRFIKIRALNFHLFWSWCVHDDLTTKKQPSDNRISFQEFFKLCGPENATLITMTDYGDLICWWQLWDVGDRFYTLKITNIMTKSLT